MFDKISTEVFSRTPNETLYHYTTFKGLIGIVESTCLWASDIRYMNDAAEYRHTVDLVRNEVGRRVESSKANVKLLGTFVDWLNRKLTNDHLLFAASFRENGNLLSQWRGYSSVGKGVSLGFQPQAITGLAEAQGYKIARCIYNPTQQLKLVASLVDELESLSDQKQNLAYTELFDQIESYVLTLTAVLKHPSFEEESEWRVISPSFAVNACPDVKFREGTSMIVPYLEFRLANDRHLAMEHMYLGPSPNSQSSINSLKMFLERHNAMPSSGISDCAIPFRAH